MLFSVQVMFHDMFHILYALSLFSSYTEIIELTAEDTLPATERTGPRLWLVGLNEDDKKILETNGWLNDRLVNAAQDLLKVQFSNVPGFQTTLLGQNFSFNV